MSMGGGGGGQAIVQTGPSTMAASMAANAQITAAQQAAQAATMNTNNAINALMGEYGTALQYQQPAAFTGNQAMAQMNYMMGLPAVGPGSAPVAPTITNSDIRQYLMGTSGGVQDFGPNNYSFNHPSYQGYIPKEAQQAIDQAIANGTITPDAPGTYNLASLGFGGLYDITGAQNGNQWVAPGIYTNLGQTQNTNPISTLANNATISDWAKQAIQQDPTNSEAYNLALQTYNQQNAAWQNENNIYQQYQAKGQATPADITDIVTNLPGFQFQQQQGLNQIQNAASAKGMLNSGALLQQLDQFGQGLSSTYYNNYMSQLGQLAGMGTNATNQISSGAMNTGNAIGNQFANLGDNLGNAYLAAGQAQASSYLTPLANQDMRVTQVGGGGGGGGFGSMLGSVAGLLGNFL